MLCICRSQVASTNARPPRASVSQRSEGQAESRGNSSLTRCVVQGRPSPDSFRVPGGGPVAAFSPGRRFSSRSTCQARSLLTCPSCSTCPSIGSRPGGEVARRAASRRAAWPHRRGGASVRCRTPSARLTNRGALTAIEILPLAEPADRHYGVIRRALERVGRPIGHNDLLIAAHARALGTTLVTDNVGEFGRVPDLAVENWR